MYDDRVEKEKEKSSSTETILGIVDEDVGARKKNRKETTEIFL